MQTTFTTTPSMSESPYRDSSDTTLVNLAAHRKSRADRFPSVDDLLDRLTDDTVSVANAGYRAR